MCGGERKSTSHRCPRAPQPRQEPPTTTELRSLRLDNYRKPFCGDPKALTPEPREQLQALVDSDMDSEGMSHELFFDPKLSDEDYPMKALEYIDVVETAGGMIAANLLLYPFGDGAVVHAGTTKMIANIVQHGVTPHRETTAQRMADFALAWKEGARRLGVDDPGHFSLD